MNKYNIKLGDYVETLDGGMGYVTNIKEDYFEWVIAKKSNGMGASNVGTTSKGYFSYVVKYYKRVGVNDFTKKKKFEPINRYNQNGIITYFDKINELIDHINAIQERLNEYDNSRTN